MSETALPEWAVGTRPFQLPASETATGLENFGAAWMQQSFLARTGGEVMQRYREFGSYAPAPVAGYSPYANPTDLAGYEDSLFLFRDSRSPEETAFLRRRVDEMRQRSAQLEGAGFVNQLLAGTVTPESVITAPLGLGPLGAATRAGRALQGAGRGGALFGGVAAGELALEALDTPTSLRGDPLLEIPMAAMLGVALGGAAGAVSARSVDRAARAASRQADAADGLRTAGAERPAPEPGSDIRYSIPPERQGWTIGDYMNAIDQLPVQEVANDFKALENQLRRLVGPNIKLEMTEPVGYDGVAATSIVRLAFNANDPVGTLYHEAIHILRQGGALSDDDMALLTRASDEQGWMDQHAVMARWSQIYGIADPRDPALIEEAIAEAFRMHASRERPQTGRIAQIFDRMAKWFAALRRELFGGGFRTAEEVFDAILAGDFAKRMAPMHPSDVAVARADARDLLDGMARRSLGREPNVFRSEKQLRAGANLRDRLESESSEATRVDLSDPPNGYFHYGQDAAGGPIWLPQEASARSTLARELLGELLDVDNELVDVDSHLDYLDALGFGRLGDDPTSWRSALARVDEVMAASEASGRFGADIPFSIERVLGTAEVHLPGVGWVRGDGAGIMLSPAPIMGNDRLAATGTKLERINVGQLPSYRLKNNSFTGSVGNAIARLADMIAQTPGLRMVGNATGYATETASVEARAAQASWHFAVSDQRQNELYFRYRGWDEAAAGPIRARAEELRDGVTRLIGRGAAALGRPVTPETALTFAEFDQQVGLAIGQGGHKIPEVAEAARFWQENFYQPFEEQGAAAGVLLTARHRTAAEGALRAQRGTAEAQLREIEVRLADPNLRPDVGRALDDLASDLKDHLRSIKDREKALKDARPQKEPYTPHRWLRSEVRAKRDDLIKVISDHWQTQAGTTWATAGMRAELAVSHLLREGLADTLQRVLTRNAIEAGTDATLAAERAAGAVAPIRDAVASTAPSKLSTEMASLMGKRLDVALPDEITDDVTEVLTNAGVQGDLKRIAKEIVGGGAKGGPNDEWKDQARPGHAQQRTIDVPTALLAPWLDLSQRAGAADYARRMGAAVEMGKQFGDPSMIGRINATMLDMLEEVAQGRGTVEEAKAVAQAIRDLRDKVLGTFQIPEDPDAISVRTVQFLVNNAVAVQMGQSVWSAITDMGRVAMAVGFQRAFGGVLNSLGRDAEAFRLGGDEAAKAGAALELVTLGRMRAMHDLNAIGADRTLVENWAQSAAEGMQFVNLLAPWTQWAQRFSGALIQSEMMELAVKATAGALATDEVARMAAYGISEDTARRMAAEWRAAGADMRGGLHLANTDAWSDGALRDQFRGALKTAVDQAVMKPGAADRPNFLAAPLMQALFLYKGFAIAATQRFLMAGLQQRDARVAAGIMSSIGIAWLLQGPTDGQFDRNPILSWERVFGAVEKSGALGLITDLNSAVEMMTNNGAGARPMLGIEAPSFAKEVTWAQQAAVVGGAAIAPWLNAVWALTDPAATPDQQAGAMRRTIWFNNLLYVDWLFRALAKEGATAITPEPVEGGGGVALPAFMGGR
jgi:hypothetical protein